VCPLAYLKNRMPNFTKFSVHVTCGRFIAYVLLYEGKCQWSYGPSCPVVFSLLYIYIYSYSYILHCVSVSSQLQQWTNVLHEFQSKKVGE